jgi:hypothetical protein
VHVGSPALSLKSPCSAALCVSPLPSSVRPRSTQKDTASTSHIAAPDPHVLSLYRAPPPTRTTRSLRRRSPARWISPPPAVSSPFGSPKLSAAGSSQVAGARTPALTRSVSRASSSPCRHSLVAAAAAQHLFRNSVQTVRSEYFIFSFKKNMSTSF